MTYTIFEYVKENIESLLTNQPDSVESARSNETDHLCDSMKSTTLRGKSLFVLITASLTDFMTSNFNSIFNLKLIFNRIHSVQRRGCEERAANKGSEKENVGKGWS